MLDRLLLDGARVRAMAEGLRSVAAQPDPVGGAGGMGPPNGLHIQRVATPLGVIGVIYARRPIVTADAAGLALPRNAVILRGGSESLLSSTAIHAALVRAGRRRPARRPPCRWSRPATARRWPRRCARRG